MSKLISTILRLVILLSIVNIMGSCSDDKDVAPTTKLSITVTDSEGNTLPQVMVSIYTTKVDWEQDTNGLTATTNSEGAATFDDLQPISYFINSEKNESNNWFGTIETSILMEATTNEVSVQLTESLATILTGKTQRVWQIKDISFDGFSLFEDVDACEKDDSFVFQREGKGTVDRGEGRCFEGDDNSDFTWSFTDQEQTLLLENAEGTSAISILSIKKEQLKLQIPTPIEGELVPLDYEFEVIQ